MKKFLPILFVLAAYAVNGQNSYIGKSDPEAAAILKKVSAKYKTYKTLSTNFDLQVENGSGQNLASRKGTVDIKGKKFFIMMDDEASFSDGSNIYNYDKSAGEVQITRVNPKDNTLTPQKLFTDFYEKDFLYKLNDEVKQGGKTIQLIELTPVDKTQPYFKVVLEIDKASSQITGAKVFEKNGNKYIYSITSTKANAAIPDSRFVFKQSDYPGAEIIDLR